jgi:hypothetical protein
MRKSFYSLRNGTTLIDLVLSMAIIALLFGGVYLVYFSIETALANVGVRTAATEAIDNEVELVRNLPYGSVGTVGGIPSGVIPQAQSVTQGNFNFVLQTVVLNIDDPYDESPSSTPVADYKLLDITASCPLCQNFVPIEITTTVAPSLLEEGTNYGSIFIYAIDANGLPVANASIRVVNASVTPSIDLTDTTNASGVLKLIGVPTSTQGYQIFASKTGYSSAQTYPAGAPSNPNPLQPNITVASQTVSNVTFAIDHVSMLTVSSTDDRCNAVGNEQFSLTGAKLIGTSPNVLAFVTSSETSASGSVSLSNIEWDTYTIALSDASQDVAGTVPFSPLTIDPSSTQTFQFILQPAANPSLLVSVADASTLAGISNANVAIADGGVNESLVTDHATFSQNNWSGGQYASQDGGIDDSNAGTLTLLANASGTYSTSTTDWLISNTFDVGGTASTFNTLSWTPATEPPNITLEFQVAANNDDATWNFVGPDGTASTYFTSTTSTLPASLAGNRYFRYEVFMSTQDPNATPVLHGVSVDFTANCVPPAQTLFTSITPGTYSVDVTAPNYVEATGTAVVGTGESSTTILMTQS